MSLLDLQPVMLGNILSIFNPFIETVLSHIFSFIIEFGKRLDVFTDKISTSLVECELVKAKIGKALRADGSPCVWKKFPPARGQKGFLS